MSNEIGEHAVITDDVEIFSEIPVNVGERHVTWVETEPVIFSKNTNNTIQFHISGSGASFIDLHRTYMYVRLKLLDKNNEPFTVSDTISCIPINNILHSLWDNIDVKCNGTLVGSANTNYMYKAMLDTLLGFSFSTQKHQLEMQGYTPCLDEFAAYSTIATDVGHCSAALRKRNEWFLTYYKLPRSVGGDSPQGGSSKRSAPSKGEYLPCAEFMGRLNIDIGQPEKLILDGVDINIGLHPTYNEFRLMTTPGTEGKIVIEDILLYVCRVTLNPTLRLVYEGFLNSGRKSTIPFTRADVQTHNIPQGSFGENLTNIFQGEIPRVAVIGFVSSQAIAGDYQLNPYHFQAFNIRSIGIFVDNEPVPTTPLKFDKGDTRYLRGLFSLYQVSGKVGEDTDIGITRDSYRLGRTLFGFLLDPTASTNASYLGTPKYGQAKIEIKFHEALEEPMTVVIYSQFPEVLEIDQARVCRLRYKSLRENPK